MQDVAAAVAVTSGGCCGPVLGASGACGVCGARPGTVLGRWRRWQALGVPPSLLLPRRAWGIMGDQIGRAAEGGDSKRGVHWNAKLWLFIFVGFGTVVNSGEGSAGTRFIVTGKFRKVKVQEAVEPIIHTRKGSQVHLARLMQPDPTRQGLLTS